MRALSRILAPVGPGLLPAITQRWHTARFAVPFRAGVAQQEPVITASNSHHQPAAPSRRRFPSPVAWLVIGLSAAAPLSCAIAQTPAGPVATWVFAPEPDRFDPAALLDLRSLNERQAGQHGFVRVDAEGGFVRGDGKPIRFWAVNTAVGTRAPDAVGPLWPKNEFDLARHARFLAKRGVNMVRLHRQISPDLNTHPDAVLTDINEAERDRIWRTVAAMREQGIYTTLSPYWAVPMKFSERWGIAGGAQQQALGLLFFDETLQAAYRQWLKKLLTEKNPYTGLPLAQDPSLAVFQLQNEDSLLFWTVDAIQGPQRAALERRFAAFAAVKHGSLVAALKAWDYHRVKGDDASNGRLALAEMWRLTQWPVPAAERARLADQTEFYARTQHEFNRRTVAYLRQELGLKALINAGNWKTASDERLGDAERWSYTPGEVDAVNHYFSGVHQGVSANWAIVASDRYTALSGLHTPQALPFNLRQSQGRPMMVTETAWVAPNPYAAEGPFLVAAYTSLSGVAAFHWFSMDFEGFAPPRSANGYLPSLMKWSFATPETLGSFPAAALAYRRGDIRTGAPALVEARPLQALWQRESPRLPEASGFDPNRDAGDGGRRAAREGSALPPETFLVGPVKSRLGAEPSNGAATPPPPDLQRFLQTQQTRSNTGELALDARRGVATIDTPRTQGVAAHFAQAPEHQLSVLGLRSRNAYGALLAVSLDDRPLAESRSVLLQYATQSRPTGWQEKLVTLALDGGGQAPGFEIVSHGEAPWRVVQPRLDVSLRNSSLKRATPLDMNGMPLADVPVQRDGGVLRLRFPPGTMYVLLR